MKKLNLKNVILILLLVVFVASVFSGCESKDLMKKYKKQIAQLDKKYSNLDDLNLNSPFKQDIIDAYLLREMSTSYHVGLDFASTDGKTDIPFLAPQDGIVIKIWPAQCDNSEGTGLWTYNTLIALNSKCVLMMGFETFSNSEEVRAKQEANIFVKEGDFVKQGDLIGNLIVGAQNAHVHFGVVDWTQKSKHMKPEPLFTPEALAQIESRVVPWEHIG